jgi:hypothetical protein
VYAIARHADHTHLVYALELPDEPGEVQEELRVEAEGSYILSVKNPEQPSPPGLGLSVERQVTLPKTLQGRFRGRRFIPVNPPSFLNYAGVEMLLIGAHEEIGEDLDVQLHPQEETAATAEIFNDLRLTKSRHPMKPLFEGTWQ